MASATDSRSVSLTIPAKGDYVVLARLALSAVCRLTSLGPDEVADLKLAITEAATSLLGDEPAAGEAAPGAEPGEPPKLSFAFRIEDERLVLEIARDSEAPRGGAPSEEEEELGRALIDAAADECEYGDRAIRLVKYLEPSGQ